jgi:hypothetical protein
VARIVERRVSSLLDERRNVETERLGDFELDYRLEFLPRPALFYRDGGIAP